MKLKNVAYSLTCLAIVAIGIGIYYWEEVTRPIPTISTASTAAKLRVLKVRLAAHAPDIKLIGTLRASNGSQYTSQTSGRILKINVKTGDMVKKGHVLMTIENADQAHVLALNKRLLKDVDRQLVRKRALYKNGTISRSALDSVVNEEARLKLQLHKAQVNYDNTLIKAKSDGMVVGVRVTKNKLVAPGMLLLQLNSFAGMGYIVYVPAKYLPQFKQLLTDPKAARATAFYQGSVIALSLHSVNATIEPGQAGVRVTYIPMRSILPPSGSVAEVLAALLPVNDSMLVPPNAVYAVGDKHYVYTVTPAHHLKKVVVTTHGVQFFHANQRYSVITSPELKTGMLVAISEVDRLNLSQSIRPVLTEI
ncbi:MAG: hypothetical protein COB66_08530 [Coxiella sp. (in: Bacteria)]|nr:MAG: hypothetical protein COB66_08530 [Coxiella sp. (in: g-proteobacteria)]